MQKFLIAAGLLVASITGAQAQNTAIKVNIFSPLVRTGSFFVERRLNDHSSAQLGALFTNWSVGDTKITGFAFTPEYRWYLSENQPALQGFYVAPFARYQNLTLAVDEMVDTPDGTTRVEGKAALNTFGGGLLVGHQWAFKKRITLDMFIGPSYNTGNLKLTAGSQSADFDAGPFTGFGVRTGLTLGVAF